jgi:3-oxoacyl-(acyl-carrier-protein) synthase
MDTQSALADPDPVVVTGVGWEASGDAWRCLTGASQPQAGNSFPHDCQPLQFLQARKSLKFMSRQDRLAVSAAGKALADAGLPAGDARTSMSLFLCVGYIPFERDEAESLCRLSQVDGRFSMGAFTTLAYSSINPIRAFTCLPNMTAHHLAVNFGILGEYFLTYPGTPQLCLALQEAVERLREGSIGRALVGAVADQTNFLVTHHHGKSLSTSGQALVDAAGFLVLERESGARLGGRDPRCTIQIRPTGAHEVAPPDIPLDLGAAGLPLCVAAFLSGGAISYEHVGGGLRSTWARGSAGAAGPA